MHCAPAAARVRSAEVIWIGFVAAVTVTVKNDRTTAIAAKEATAFVVAHLIF